MAIHDDWIDEVRRWCFEGDGVRRDAIAEGGESFARAPVREPADVAPAQPRTAAAADAPSNAGDDSSAAARGATDGLAPPS